jgi:hypothetical protein
MRLNGFGVKLYYVEVPAYVAASNDMALPSHHKAENDFSALW